MTRERGSDWTGLDLVSARKNIKMTQRKLAYHLGCTPETLSRIENGSEPVSKQMKLAVLALTIGIRPEYEILRENDPA